MLTNEEFYGQLAGGGLTDGERTVLRVFRRLRGMFERYLTRRKHAK